MKIGIINYPSNENKFGIDFKAMKDDGYDSFDYQGFMGPEDKNLYTMSEDEFEIFMKELKEESYKNGLKIHQLHSLWTIENSIEKDFDKSIPYYIRAIKGASLLDCPYVVIHHRFPFGFENQDDKYDEGMEFNVNFLKALMPYAHKYNVTICLENLPFRGIRFCSIKSTAEIIDRVNDQKCKMCLDTGHCYTFDDHDDIYQDVVYCDERIKTIHVHDDSRHLDMHMIPFYGGIDWAAFKKGLTEIGFDGVFSLETMASAKLPHNIWVKERKILFEIADYIANKL